MGLQDVYFPIAGNPKIFAISTNSGGDKDGKETKSKTVNLDNVPIGGQLTFFFDTIDGKANNGLQGTFNLSTDNPKIEFFSEKLEQSVSQFNIPEEPTVEGESTSETHIITIRVREGFENDNIKFASVRIDFSGTVEILDPGFDSYSLLTCCPCESFPYIDENGCERYCECPPPANCDNDIECPCNSFCDTTFFDNPIYKNGEGTCETGCKQSSDCCQDGENGYRCDDGECVPEEDLTDCPCPKGQVCIGGKCEDDGGNDGDGGFTCQNDNDCNDGYCCKNGTCAPCEDPPLFGKNYIFSQKIRASLEKYGFNYDYISNVGVSITADSRAFADFTDETLVYRRYRTVDLDEGCQSFRGTFFGRFGSEQGDGPCDVDNLDGIEETSISFGQLYASMKGTDYDPPDELVLDEAKFDTPYKSSELRDSLKTALLQTSFRKVNNRVRNNTLIRVNFDEDGSLLKSESIVSSMTDASISYSGAGGSDGFAEKLRYFFAQKIELSTGSLTTTYLRTDQLPEPLKISLSVESDNISISQKDSYVPGRTSNENFVNVGVDPVTIQWIRTPAASRIINKVFKTPSGTEFTRPVREVVVVTQEFETSVTDYGVNFNLTGNFTTTNAILPSDLFQSGKVKKPLRNGSCQNNSDCPDGQKCQNGKCIDKNPNDPPDDPHNPPPDSDKAPTEPSPDEPPPDEPTKCPEALPPLPNAVSVT